MVFIHAAYGAAASAIDVDAGPCQLPLARFVITELYEAAAERISVASWLQAALAASIGAEPAPEYILAELISGGSTA